MSKIHFLPVKYGDSFVIECDKGENHGVVVIDGGPNGCGPILQAQLDQVGTPDLMVLTHYDDDHIGGLTQYIKACRKAGQLPAREVWANCAKYADTPDDSLTSTRSALQGVKLGVLLDMIVAEGGELSWRDDVIEGFVKEFPFADIEVVSPTEKGRQLAIGKQEKVMVGKTLESLTRSMDKSLDVLPPEVEPLEKAALDCPKPPSEKTDADVANAASIAILLRCDGLSALLLGDCYPHNVVDYLRAKGYSEENPLEVDFVKVAHHGSLHNTSNELLDLIKSYHFLISTNGDKFGHPDREAFAHILCHPTRDRSEKVHFYFNSDLKTLKSKSGLFLVEGEEEAYNFEIHECVRELPLTGDEPADVEPADVEPTDINPVDDKPKDDKPKDDRPKDTKDTNVKETNTKDTNTKDTDAKTAPDSDLNLDAAPSRAIDKADESAEQPAPAPKKKRVCFLRRLFSGFRFNLDFSSKKK